MKVIFDPILGKPRSGDDASVSQQDLTAAIEDHNGSPDAHEGLLLGISPSPGGVMTGRTDAHGSPIWTEQIGDYMEPVIGDFTAAPGVVYTLELTSNKTIYIEAGGASDYDFGLLVTQGATAYTLTLLGEQYPILFPDDNVPPRYASGNTPPGIATANTAYMFRFHWDAENDVLLANLAYGVEVTQ